VALLAKMYRTGLPSMTIGDSANHYRLTRMEGVKRRMENAGGEQGGGVKFYTSSSSAYSWLSRIAERSGTPSLKYPRDNTSLS
jgi:hypothetical protein